MDKGHKPLYTYRSSSGFRLRVYFYTVVVIISQHGLSIVDSLRMCLLRGELFGINKSDF